MPKNAHTLLFFFFLVTSFSVAQEVKFGKVSQEELQEKSYQNDTSAVATVLYRKRNLNFRYQQGVGFKVVTQVHERVKIYSKDGFDYATVAESLYKNGGDKESMSAIKAFTYNLENGQVVKSKLEKSGIFSTSLNKYYDEDKFTLPNVKEGSVIEYEYRIESPFYWSIDEIVLQYDIPIKYQEVAIETPEYFMFKPSEKGYLPLNPKNGQKSGRITLTSKSSSGTNGYSGGRNNFSQQTVDYRIMTTDYVMNDVPALKEEPFVNDMDNYRSSVNYELQYTQFPQSIRKSYTSTWEDIIKSIYESDSFGDQLDYSKYYKDDLAAILAATSTDTEKISAIFNHVQNRMSWNTYFGYYVDKGVKKAYEEKSGNIADINLMLTSMLKKAGLTANPVLVSTRDHGVPLFPTREGFNYVIAAVELDGGVILLDASNKYSEPDILPTRALNWYGKLVKEDRTYTTVSLLPQNASKENINMNVVLNENGNITGKFRNTYSDYNAYVFRNSYGSVDEEDYLEKLENKNDGMEISNYNIKNKKSLGKPVMESYEFVLDNQADVIGDKIYFSPLFHLVTDENPFKLEERNYPIDFTYPRQDKYRMNIAIPDGYEVTSKPENVSLALVDRVGSFAYKVIQNGKYLQVLVDFKINQAVIGANYYSDLKELFKNAIEKQTEKVVLSKIGTDGTTNSSEKGR